jgi:hypothetical protein
MLSCFSDFFIIALDAGFTCLEKLSAPPTEAIMFDGGAWTAFEVIPTIRLLVIAPLFIINRGSSGLIFIFFNRRPFPVMENLT